MATVLLIRHGRAEGNSHHRFIGWSDVPLEAAGVAEAEATAVRLADSVDRIVASDLRRTMQTAGALAERTGLEIEADPRFREIDNGGWTGHLPEEIAADWPDLWAAYVGGEDVARPGGERWAAVRSRVTAAVTELLAGDGTIAVVTHGGPVVLTAAWALGLDLPGNPFRGSIAAAANCGITTIVAGPRLVAYNDVGHLRDVPPFDVPYAAVEAQPRVADTTADQVSSSNVASPPSV